MAFDAEELVDRAITATGLDDFGEPTWREGLDRVLDGFANEANLNDIGMAMADADMSSYLANRLGIVEWRRTHPEVADVEIVRPVVIVGQPRTGTTILLDLLAQDPSNRAALTWEVDHPCPPPTVPGDVADPRIELSQGALDMADVLIPGFTDFHPIGALLAQECVRITGSEFRSMIFPTQYEMPTYNRWLIHEADAAPAYRWHRRFLQHLQSGYMADRWLLKSPAHLWHIPELMAEYPDAIVIQTHRDPLKVIASVSALAAHLRQMASDEHSIARAALQYQDDIFCGLDRSLEARRAGVVPDGSFVDVHFTDFVQDPFGTIRGIYDQVGIELTPAAEAAMRAFLAAHPGDGGGGGTRYTWADTGLDAGLLRERAREYQEAFGVVSEAIS